MVSLCTDMMTLALMPSLQFSIQYEESSNLTSPQIQNIILSNDFIAMQNWKKTSTFVKIHWVFISNFMGDFSKLQMIEFRIYTLFLVPSSGALVTTTLHFCDFTKRYNKLERLSLSRLYRLEKCNTLAYWAHSYTFRAFGLVELLKPYSHFIFINYKWAT
jgi:hypothetical protein